MNKRKILFVSFCLLLPSSYILSAPVRGVSGDLWADVVLGQDDFTGAAPNTVVNGRGFNLSGVVVDRYSNPQRLYIFDGNNSRILGYSNISIFTPNQGITGTGFNADMVFGQPDFTHCACNGDSNFGNYPVYPQPSASSLCGTPLESGSPWESGCQVTMAVDQQGNLYVPDVFNNRVLRYNTPAAGSQGIAASYEWGQADMVSGYHQCAVSAAGLCFYLTGRGGVAIDSVGNLWVCDSGNNRVLRFPNPNAPNQGVPISTADVVLGQIDFTHNVSTSDNTVLNQMNQPDSVCVDNAGNVFVLDAGLERVLVFQPSGTDTNGNPAYTNGMSASGMITNYFQCPTGMGLDISGNVWVTDMCTNQVILFNVSFPGGVFSAAPKEVLLQYQPVGVATPFSAISGDARILHTQTGK